MDHNSVLKALAQPTRLFTYSEVLAAENGRLTENGIYGFWFRRVPGVPVDGCQECNGYYLHYIGIAAGQPMQGRFKKHFAETASVSTLRLSIGCLMDMTLTRAGKDSVRFENEGSLSAWLYENAVVSWVICNSPDENEKALLKVLSLPLNLQNNRHHPFRAELMAIRSAAKKKVAQA